MAKISRPVLYAALLGVVGYTVVVLTEPEAPARRKSSVRTAATAKAPTGFLPEDLEASFERPGATNRNAFKPGVVPQNTAGLLAGENALSNWTLTGITVVEGRRRALLENASTGESVFLETGQRWNDLAVRTIEPDAVVFVNKNGETVRLGFPEPEAVAEVAPVTVAVPALPGAPVAPTAVSETTTSVTIPADDAARRGRRRNR